MLVMMIVDDGGDFRNNYLSLLSSLLLRLFSQISAETIARDEDNRYNCMARTNRCKTTDMRITYLDVKSSQVTDCLFR